MKVVIDHVSGSRRGQRQEFIGQEVISFGRHPRCDVRFDAHRDIDASSRHAELQVGETIRLVDVGSSNGTFINGANVVEHDVALRTQVVVEFGGGGPQVVIWVGDDADLAPPPTVSREPGSGRISPWIWLTAGLLAVIAAIVAFQLSR